jgi:hypothetical protein
MMIFRHSCLKSLILRCLSSKLLLSSQGKRKDACIGSVGDPDPHVFVPPGSVSQRYGSGSFPFLIMMLTGMNLCLPNVKR